MNRKTKIIVSVVGIVIVTLALLGITYAYYLTRIEGNTNTNSISLTTANLLLKYDDGTGAIVEENIMPGVTFTKTFSVTNEGNATIDNYVVYLEDVINDLTRTQDLTYKLTCDNCAGSNGVYPKFAGIIATNSIEVGQTHTYTLKVTYENLTDTDQSVDMGSRISGYIQIYNLQDIVDITGSVVNATDGDYVQINSEPKISQIVDGKYMLGAIEPGNHTITVRYKESNGDEQIRSTKEIVIQKGNETKVEGNTITVTNDSQTITLNINATDSSGYEITNTIKEYNPFNEGTLAFDIYKNAKENKNGTTLLNIPKTNIAESISQYGTGEFSYETVNTGDLCSGTLPWLVGDTPVAAQSGSSVSSYEDAVGKYVYDQCSYWTKYLDSYDSSTSTLSFKSEIMVYESILSMTSDDYGTSYYFRGNVQDNYVNFAGMCWRIVRIAGDGSTKLILEDATYECNSASYTGNWNIGVTSYGYEIKNLNSNSSGPIMNYLKPASDVSSMVRAFYNFQKDKLSDYTSKLKSGDWCLGDKAYKRSGSSGSYTYTLLEEYDYSGYMYYDAYTRLTSGNANGYQPTLKCNGTVLDKFAKVLEVSEEAPMYVSALTADEIVFAGGKEGVANLNYYLVNNPYKSSNFSFWALSPSFFGPYDLAFIVNNDGNLSSGNVYDEHIIALRPSVSLASSAVITEGEGTLEKPYVID